MLWWSIKQEKKVSALTALAAQKSLRTHTPQPSGLVDIGLPCPPMIEKAECGEKIRSGWYYLSVSSLLMSNVVDYVQYEVDRAIDRHTVLCSTRLRIFRQISQLAKPSHARHAMISQLCESQLPALCEFPKSTSP